MSVLSPQLAYPSRLSVALPAPPSAGNPFIASATLQGTNNAAQSSAAISAQATQQQIMLNEALTRLGSIVNPPQDVAALKTLGITPLFTSGAQALKLIQDRGIQVEFGDMGPSAAHAEWQSGENRIIINQKYKNDRSNENLYAISEAIYHEAGHAKGNGDDRSSIQEEINCLALNALGYRCHAATDPAYAASASKSPLISNGVALYSHLFFSDTDPTRQALVRRVTEKYGDLSLQSPGHAVNPDGQNLANRVAEAKRQQSVANYYRPVSDLSAPTNNPFVPAG